MVILKKTMGKEITNYSRFYAAFNKLPYEGDREEFKQQVVGQYTWGRTGSLREMTREEYDACCDALERMSGGRDEQRKRRSVCLKLMQELGVDTTDWPRINAFCEHPKIAGKVFAKLTIEELKALSVKLRSIKKKGGLNNPAEKPQGTVAGTDGKASGTVAGREIRNEAPVVSMYPYIK